MGLGQKQGPVKVKNRRAKPCVCVVLFFPRAGMELAGSGMLFSIMCLKFCSKPHSLEHSMLQERGGHGRTCPFAGNRGASVPSHPIPWESSLRKAPGIPRGFLAPRGFLQEILHLKLVQSSPGTAGGMSLPWNCCLWSDGSAGIGMSETKE